MRPITSASNLHRRKLCPGSARLEEGLPEIDSEEAREGKLLHDYAAHREYDRRLLKPHQKDLVDLSDSLAATVIEHVERDSNLQGVVNYAEYIEKTMQLDGADFGTPDLARFYLPDLLSIVLDRKFGWNLVERADLNYQLRAYAVLACDFHPTEKVCVGILQPRAPFDERITVAVYTPDDIKAAKAEIYSILKESARPQARLIAGDAQCQYCKAKAALACPAFNAAMTLPENIRPDLALSKTAREAFLERKISECNDEQLTKLVLAVRLAKMAHEPVYNEVRKRVAAGAMKSCTVAKDSEIREIVNIRKAMSLLSLAGIASSDAYDCVTEFSVTKLAEKLRKKHPNWTWKQANDWINKKLQSVIAMQTRKGRVTLNDKLTALENHSRT